MEREQLEIQTPAKLNLGLEVIGKRPDGYHEIVTILQAISLYDRFTWTPNHEGFSYEAAADLMADHDIVRTVLDGATDRSNWCGRLRLEKEIPIAAGLGGGSSDAVVALRLAYPDCATEELTCGASRLGSDAPFFVTGGTAIATGRGERLTKLPSPSQWYVIVMPDVWIPHKTRTLYQGLKHEDFSDGGRIRAIAAALTAGNASVTRFPNAFERQMRAIDRVAEAWECLASIAGRPANLSGAGPAIFVVADHQAHANAIADTVVSRGYAAKVAHSLATDTTASASQAVAVAMRC